MVEILLSLAAIILGLWLLVFSGDKLVDGSVSIARKFSISEAFIGMTIIGFGTSAPEFVTALKSAFVGKTDLLMGNLVGSNIANMLLVLGVGFLFYNQKRNNNMVTEKMSLFTTTLGLLLFAVPTFFANNLITNVWGAVFLIFFLSQVGFMYLHGKELDNSKNEDDDNDESSETPETLTISKAIIYISLSFVGLYYGAELLIGGSSKLAIMLGIPDRIIGLTIVAVGSSLPELASSIAAARQNKMRMCFGNIMGSNLFNILFSTGFAAFIVNIDTSKFDFSILIMLVTLILLIPVVVFKKLPIKIYGVLLLSLYSFYIYNLVITM